MLSSSETGVRHWMKLIHAGCSALIVVHGMPVNSDVLAAAEKQGTLTLSSPHPTFATVQLMTMSEPVEAIMQREYRQWGSTPPSQN